MREASTMLRTQLDSGYNTSQLLVDRLARGGGAPIHCVKRGDSWVDVSTAAFTDTVRGVAKALIAAGLAPGESVAIMSRTRYEWAVAEQAIWFAGGVSVPIYETSSAYQVEWILRDSGARLAFAEDDARAAVLRSAAAALDVDVLVLGFDALDDDAPAPGLASRDSGTTPVPADAVSSPGIAVLAAAGHAGAVTDAAVEAARRSRGLADVATLVYTSGTTGRPKGCMMTHGNFAEIAVNLVPHMREVVAEGSRTLMFLPLAHVLARAVQQCCVFAGVTVGHTSGAADLLGDLRDFRPDFLLAVPRIFEKIRAGAYAKAEAAGKAGLFLEAERVAIAVSRARDARTRGLTGPAARVKPLDRAKHAVFNRVLYPKLREVLGGRARYTISGASELNTDLAHFFRGAGVVLLEGYGLTETTAPATVNMPANTRVGSVGIPVPGTTVRISANGEVLIRGIGVFAGYHANPDASAECFDEDGFLRTGDLGSLDEDGFLTITGRRKDLLVTAGGKNVSPGPLEELVRNSRLVSQAVVVGEGRPFIAALVTLDAEEVRVFQRNRGAVPIDPAEAASDPAVLAQVQAAVDAANATVSRAEAIRKFVVLDTDFTEASGHLTPSLKLKRSAVLESHRAQIDALYSR